jgi:cell wall assembly regulator SMI1
LDDGRGNHHCLDLEPAKEGRVGQIITMWHDDAERTIVAPSFQAWLQQYVEDLESNKLHFCRTSNSICYNN